MNSPRWTAKSGRRAFVFAGLDEAGRGPLAGPVVAGCAVMPCEPLLCGVDDSKKLSAKRREALYERILETAVFAGTGVASVEEIDRLNILEATRLAMERAAGGRAVQPVLWLDAMEGVRLPGRLRSVIHGDALCYSIAAASILAKVTRDRMMQDLDARYPAYGFARHKGYGTAAHVAALRAQRPLPPSTGSCLYATFSKTSYKEVPACLSSQGATRRAGPPYFWPAADIGYWRRYYTVRGARVDIIAKDGETYVLCGGQVAQLPCARRAARARHTAEKQRRICPCRAALPADLSAAGLARCALILWKSRPQGPPLLRGAFDFRG